MFKTGDVVKYGVNGICEITGIEIRPFCGSDMEYYVLKSLSSKDTTFFIPTANEMLTSRIQNILSKDEIYALLKELIHHNAEWIENDKLRAEHFSKILLSKDRAEIIGLIRTLYHKRCELQTAKKKMHASDERILKDAERIISDEFATVLDIDKSEVGNFIASFNKKNL